MEWLAGRRKFPKISLSVCTPAPPLPPPAPKLKAQKKKAAIKTPPNISSRGLIFENSQIQNKPQLPFYKTLSYRTNYNIKYGMNYKLPDGL